MTHGKKLKPKEEGGRRVTSAPSQKKQGSGVASVPAGSLHMHMYVCASTHTCTHTRYPWQCPSASSAGHCLPSPEPPSVSPGNWWLAPGPLSLVHHGLHDHLHSSIEVSRVSSLLSPDWSLALFGSGRRGPQIILPHTTLCDLHSSAPPFPINVLSISQVL